MNPFITAKSGGGEYCVNVKVHSMDELHRAHDKVLAAFREGLRDEVRQLILSQAKPTQAAWAKEHNISPAYVSDVIAGRREPGEKILRALGLERVVTYRPKPKENQ